jgi:hypothetical protein
MTSRVTRRLLLSALAVVPALALAPATPVEAQPAGDARPSRTELRAQKKRIKHLRGKQKRLLKRQRAQKAR